MGLVPPETTEDVTGLLAGNHSVIVTDASGCVYTAEFFVSEPDLLAATETIVDVSCFGGLDGSIDISVVGGVSPYTHNWSNGDSTAFIDSLWATTYTDTIIDLNGCVLIQSFTVGNPPQFSQTNNMTNVSCFGGSDGSISVVVGGGTTPYNYLWSSGGATPNITGLSAGLHVLTVTDGNSCIMITPIAITEPESGDTFGNSKSRSLGRLALCFLSS